MNQAEKRISQIIEDDSFSLEFKNKVIELLKNNDDFCNLRESESFSDILFTKFFGLNDEVDYKKIKSALYELYCMCNQLMAFTSINSSTLKDLADKVDKINEKVEKENQGWH